MKHLNSVSIKPAAAQIGFRQHESFVAGLNAKLAENVTAAELFDQRGQRKGLRIPGNSADGVRAVNASWNAKFQMAVNELNARFRQADCHLHYHNGFKQISEDQTVAQEIETPLQAGGAPEVAQRRSRHEGSY